MSTEVLVSRCKSKIAFQDYAFLTAAPVVFLGAAFFGLNRYGWLMFFAIFSFSILIGLYAYFYATERLRLIKSNLVFDPQHSSITFRHFRFTSSFLPQKPREEETIRFDQVISIGRFGDVAGLELRTEKGKVVISPEMEHFDAIEDILSDLVKANASRADEFKKSLQAEPKIKTAWYGWLILLISIATVIYVGWKFMYSE